MTDGVDTEIRAEGLALARRLALGRVGFAAVVSLAGNFGLYHLALGRPEADTRLYLVSLALPVLYLAAAVVVLAGITRAQRLPLSAPRAQLAQCLVVLADYGLLTAASLLPLKILRARGIGDPHAVLALLFVLPCMLHGMHLNVERFRALAAVFATAGLGALFLAVPPPPGSGLALGAWPLFAVASVVYVLVTLFCHISVKRTRDVVRRSVDRGVWRDRLARSLPAPAVEAIERDGGIRLGGAQQQAVILFSDIRGFTGMAEQMQPEVVLTFLNRYFHEMVEAVFRHGGTLDKFIGDSLMAVFTATDGPAAAAAAALACARQMHERLHAFNEVSGAQGRASVRMVVAIHYGPVIAGWIGSVERPEFTVIGDTVNVAARLEGLAKTLEQDILVSDAAALALAPRPSWLAELGEHAVRGRVGTIVVHGWVAAPGTSSGAA